MTAYTPDADIESQVVQNVVLLATDTTVFGFDLRETFRITMGRHESNDITLKSKNVSNYHAEVRNEAGSLVLYDLRSTNGTYVNGEGVESRVLVHGDQIRVGRHEISVRLSGQGEPSVESLLPSVPPTGRFFRDGAEGPTLDELLRSVCGQQVSVTISLSSDLTPPVEVYIQDGNVVYAESGQAQGEKALYRAFTWPEGDYEIEPFPWSDTVPRSMCIPVETLATDAREQANQLDELLLKLPPFDAPLQLRENCTMRICDFTPAELEVLLTVVRAGTLAGAVEGTLMTDSRFLTHAQALLEKTAIELEASASLLESTEIFSRETLDR